MLELVGWVGESFGDMLVLMLLLRQSIRSLHGQLHVIFAAHVVADGIVVVGGAIPAVLMLIYRLLLLLLLLVIIIGPDRCLTCWP